jgi:5-methylcytosine-specific restriction endonuclease McrA
VTILNKRTKPRRSRPDIFYTPPAEETWEEISIRVRTKWWKERTGHLLCGICSKPIVRWEDLVPDHIVPGKMGGCKDHSEENLQPAHHWCNREKGSRRNFTKVSA